MKKLLPATAVSVIITAASLTQICLGGGHALTPAHAEAVRADSMAPGPQAPPALTEQDYVDVARELGVETAAIKAVVEIEAGKQHCGFAPEGTPIVNFDLSMFRRSAGKRGVNLSRYYRTHPQVFSRRGRSSQAQVWSRLQHARTIDNTAAVEGTFWGMFQIGGFNWRKCGCKSIDEFVEMMSRSERDQLELFARFVRSTGLLKSLQSKNWASFASVYNGPSYARRGYHTRMAAAYSRHKAAEAARGRKEEEAVVDETPARPLGEVSSAIVEPAKRPKTSTRQRRHKR